MSRIDVARADALGKPVTLAGIAFAGERGVSGVEISDDGGKTWQSAQVRSPNTPSVWSLWVTQWVPRTRGAIRLLVRAIDGSGKVQSTTSAPPFPDGSSGLHSVEVHVR